MSALDTWRRWTLRRRISGIVACGGGSQILPGEEIKVMTVAERDALVAELARRTNVQTDALSAEIYRLKAENEKMKMAQDALRALLVELAAIINNPENGARTCQECAIAQDPDGPLLCWLDKALSATEGK